VGIAEGALKEVSDLLVSARALAVHAANTGVVTTAQVAADQAELDNIVSTIDRIAAVTRFAGQAVFNPAADLKFHIGEGATAADAVTLSSGRLDLDTASLNIDAISLGQSATTALGAIDAAISTIAGVRGYLGALQKNTLQTNINSLSVALENVTATESFIRDANMAEETSAFTKNQILVQAGISVLAQANVASQSVLQLLG